LSGLFDRIEAKALGMELSQAGAGPALLQPVPVGGVKGGDGIEWLADEVARPPSPEAEARNDPAAPAPHHTLLDAGTKAPTRFELTKHKVTERVERTEIHREKITERRDVPRGLATGESPGKPATAAPAQASQSDQKPARHACSTPEETAPDAPAPVAQLQPATFRLAPKAFNATTQQQQSRDQAAPRQKSPTVQLRIGAITVKAAPPTQAPNPPTPAPDQSTASAPPTARAAGGKLTSYLGWRR
jgi:hypothetical protein